MAASDYATLADVKLHLQIPTDYTHLHGWLNFIIPIVSREIDGHCRRHFWPKTATYYYDYQTAKKLFLKRDLWSVTEIKHGTSTAEVLDSSHYFLYPEIGPPYQWIEINHSSVVNFRFSQYTTQQSIKITGVWGYLEDGAIPSRVTLAACAWINYLNRIRLDTGVKSKSIGNYSVSYNNVLDTMKDGPPNEVKSILDKLIRRTDFATNIKDNG